MASLYEMARGPSFDPYGSFMEGRGLKQKDQINKFTLAELQRGDMARSFAAPALAGDKGAFSKLMALDPGMGMKVKDQQFQQTKFDREITEADLEVIGGAVQNADTPEKYAQAMDYLQAQGIPIDDDDRDFSNRQTILDAALGAKGAALNDFRTQRTTQNTNGPKPPAGYRWTDTGDLTPITGGPADPTAKGGKNQRLSPMPAELAARIGLAEDFGRQYPQLRTDIEGGAFGEPEMNMESLGKRRDMVLRRGEQGRIMREIKGGSEALTRMLTGAGMNMAEAQNEVQQYLPEATDTTTTIISKLDMLQRRLGSMIESSSAGRARPGQQQPAEAAQAASPGQGDDAETEAAMQDALDAIKQGADPQAVKQELINMGVDPDVVEIMLNGQ